MPPLRRRTRERHAPVRQQAMPPLRRRTRERHAPVRYNHAVFFCSHVTLAPQQRSQQRPKVHAAEQFARPVTNHSSAFAFTVTLLLILSLLRFKFTVVIKCQQDKNKRKDTMLFFFYYSNYS